MRCVSRYRTGYADRQNARQMFCVHTLSDALSAVARPSHEAAGLTKAGPELSSVA